MVSAKESLMEIGMSQIPMDVKVDQLISRPQGRKLQVTTTEKILKESNPLEILKIVNEVMIPKARPRISGLTNGDSLLATFHSTMEAASNINIGKHLPVDPEIDHISVYRIALESLNRLVLKDGAKNGVSDEVLDFIW